MNLIKPIHTEADYRQALARVEASKLTAKMMKALYDNLGLSAEMLLAAA